MPRWKPGARERLQHSALELFTTRGFDRTTAAEIARDAGLTERTFYRYFADKREVLFDGQDEFIAAFTDAIDGAPAGARPIALMAAAVRAGTAPFTDDRRGYARMRQAVIDANPSLQERERHKLAGLAAALAAAMRERGVAEPAATLAAESCATVVATAFTQWRREGESRSLPQIAAAVLDDLIALARS